MSFFNFFGLFFIEIILIFSFGNSFSSQIEKYSNIDKNAFRMSFGKRNQKTINSPSSNWSLIDKNSFRMSFGKRSYFLNEKEQQKQQIKKIPKMQKIISIPMFFNLDKSIMPYQIVRQLKQQRRFLSSPDNIFNKRLDRNLFNIGFGK